MKRDADAVPDSKLHEYRDWIEEDAKPTIKAASSLMDKIVKILYVAFVALLTAVLVDFSVPEPIALFIIQRSAALVQFFATYFLVA